MIKALMRNGDGQPIVLLGITSENITRMIANEPLFVDLTDLHLPPTQVVIVYGKTERHIVAALEQSSLLPPGTASDMPEPTSSEDR